MDPFTQMLIVSLITGGLNFAGGLVGGGGQELESFTGTPDTDPVRRLARVVQEIEGLSGTAKGFAGEPVRLRSAFAQQPSTFSGGGLPMPIGVTGVDPALADPSLLKMPGINFGSLNEDFSTRGDKRGGPGDDGDDRGPGIPAARDEAIRRRQRPRGDSEEALAALRMLL